MLVGWLKRFFFQNKGGRRLRSYSDTNIETRETELSWYFMGVSDLHVFYVYIKNINLDREVRGLFRDTGGMMA